MIKKIQVSQLKMGMYVHEFCGPWMDHPFWRSKFLVKAQTEFDQIANGAVTELLIDTDKGVDVDGATGEEVSLDDAATRESDFVASIYMDLPALASPKSAVAEAEALVRNSMPQIASLFSEARLGKAIDTEGCEQLVEEISDSVIRNPGALISIARLKRRDEYTYMHSIAVCALMVSLARQAGLSEVDQRQAGLAGMLHDLGKALIPLAILNKPGALTPAEFATIKTHPERGRALLLEGRGSTPAVLDVCLHHHEKVDGTGYPYGLKGDQIGLLAKMGAVCDVYDAITSVRPYKTGWDPGEALRKMSQWAGHFDTKVFHAFVKAVGIYPVGSLVRLASGRLAVVMSQHPSSLLTPKVKVFFSTKSMNRMEPQELDLSSAFCKDKIVASESPETWKFKNIDDLWRPADA